MPTGTVTTKERRAAPTLSLETTSQTGEEAAAAISVSGLVKRFGATRALDGLDLTVRSGEVHGFLGPNGAGKTTTDPRPARAAARATAARRRCSAATRGATRSRCTVASRTCRAT